MITMQMNRYHDLVESMDQLESFYALPEIDQGMMVKSEKDSNSAVKIENKSFTWGVKTKTAKQIKKDEEAKEKKKKEKKEAKAKAKVSGIKEEENEDKEEKLEVQKLSELVHLKDISLDIKKGEFVCIIGEIGAGKTNLFSAFLGDMFNINDKMVSNLGGAESELTTEDDRNRFMNSIIGHNDNLPEAPICVNGSIAYSQQTPWIQSKTIRENILFETPLDKSRYYDVIKMCELENDFKEFKAGDLSEIGENGINLSGG